MRGKKTRERYHEAGWWQKWSAWRSQQPSLAKLVESHEFRNSRAKLFHPRFDFQSELGIFFLFFSFFSPVVSRIPNQLMLPNSTSKSQRVNSRRMLKMFVERWNSAWNSRFREMHGKCLGIRLIRPSICARQISGTQMQPDLSRSWSTGMEIERIRSRGFAAGHFLARRNARIASGESVSWSNARAFQFLFLSAAKFNGFESRFDTLTNNWRKITNDNRRNLWSDCSCDKKEKMKF